MTAPFGRLMVLTDFHFQQRLSHAELAREAAAGGADVIQFRQKAGGIRHVFVSALATRDACADCGVALVVDDHVDLALAVEADGVHLGQEDLPVPVARRLLGAGGIVGATATTVEQALRAEREGAAYIGFGPVFPTGSKANPASVKGLEGLEAVCRAVRVPVYAIAGVTPERVAPVLAAGAHGVAVMTAVTCAPDPAEAAARFRAALDAAPRAAVAARQPVHTSA